MSIYDGSLPILHYASSFSSKLNNLAETTINFANSNRVHETIGIIKSTFSSLQEFSEKPTFWNAGKLAVNISESLFNNMFHIPGPKSFFEDNDDWKQATSQIFSASVLSCLKQYKCRTIVTADNDYVINIYDVDGIDVGVGKCEDDVITSIYVKTQHTSDAEEVIKKLLWKKFGNKPLVMMKNLNSNDDSRDSVIEFKVDDIGAALESKDADMYAQRIQKFIDAGIHRSIMFYGPPGTGKSTLTRMIVKKLGLRSLRVPVTDDVSNELVRDAVKMFKPDVVIIDDFDRTCNQIEMLETLEFFQKNLKLVIVTANDKNELQDALMRPERLDELFPIEKLDDDVTRSLLTKMIGEYTQEEFDEIKEWPVAYIQEYAKQRRVLGKSAAKEAIILLAKRVKEITENYKNENIKDYDSILKNQKSGAANTLNLYKQQRILNQNEEITLEKICK